MKAEDTFQALLVDASVSGAGYVYRRMLPDSPFDVRLELIRPSDNRRICVRAIIAPEQLSAKQTKGFATTYSAEDGLLRVELLDGRLVELFSALVDNFLTALHNAEPGADPAQVLLDRMALWQRLFEELAFTGLSDEAKRGLFGELTFLKVLFPILGATASVDAWKAPSRTSKDFMHKALAIEVKSRFKKAQQTVRISSEHQLDPAGFDLYLAIVTIDSETSAGESLVEAVKGLRKALSDQGVAMFRFEDQLVKAGYLDIHEPFYGSEHYTSTCSLYRVSDGFPRLTGSNLPNGVTQVSYNLDIARLASFAVELDSLQEALGMANG